MQLAIGLQLRSTTFSGGGGGGAIIERVKTTGCPPPRIERSRQTGFGVKTFERLVGWLQGGGGHIRVSQFQVRQYDQQGRARESIACAANWLASRESEARPASPKPSLSSIGFGLQLPMESSPVE